MEEQKFMLKLYGAFAVDHAFKLALCGKLAGKEQRVPKSYVDVTRRARRGEHSRGVSWGCHEWVKDRCEEIANAETLDGFAFAFEGHVALGGD